MKSDSQIAFNKNSPQTLTIKVKKTPNFIRLVLLSFSIIGFLIPIVATIIVLIGGEFKIGILITYVILWGVSYYLLRLYLWNSFGQEIILWKEESIEYYPDYRLFKGNRQNILNNEDLVVTIFDTNELKEGYLAFVNKDRTIKSAIRLSNEDLIEILKTVHNSA